jgi:hypothetical protein
MEYLAPRCGIAPTLQLRSESQLERRLGARTTMALLAPFSKDSWTGIAKAPHIKPSTSNPTIMLTRHIRSKHGVAPRESPVMTSRRTGGRRPLRPVIRLSKRHEVPGRANRNLTCSVLEARRQDYNEEQPRSRLRWLTPQAYAASLRHRVPNGTARSRYPRAPRPVPFQPHFMVH